jgi:hypothetical protein
VDEMIELKKIGKDAIPGALKKAVHYRTLKEPYEAESICQDILAADPQNQDALILLLLSLTDKFAHDLDPSFSKAQELIAQLSDRYCKYYYQGIIFERRAKVHLQRNVPGSGQVAYEWLAKAMKAYAQGLTICDPNNQDALLRWNTCARIINDNPHVKPSDNSKDIEMLDSWD